MDFTETYAILENVPKDGGSLSEPILFYISAGVHNDSLNFYLQYGKKSRQFLMHVRECSSKAITLHCTHARSKSAKCKATARIIILDPKVIKSEKKVQAKRDRTIFKLDYEFPDIKDLSKYGTVTTIKPHTCQSTPSLFGVSLDLQSCFHALPLISGICLQFFQNAFKLNGGSAEPQLMIHGKEAPAASVPQFWLSLYAYPLCGIPLVIFYRTKMWIFSKTPVIKERLEIRTKCVAIFKKRQILNRFLSKDKLEGRKSSLRGTYSTIGRSSMNRQTTMRKTEMK
ncbi:unnamed protein product [Oikopleura dioica]|uniref:Uncharacterized protein n=1 Tax=Oikopleura dioica TaxID=34765 RepID=E4XL61_OIKDI|nr:unnamed protein product [Oikopleura dioica]